MGKRWVSVIVVAVPAAFIFGLVYLFLHPQLTLTLEDVVHADPSGQDVSTDVEDITESVCGEQLGCVEAYSTAEADYFRFRSHAAASEYASTLDDSFSVNYFVMDFAGKDAPVRDQLFAMQVLAGTWNDYEGDFPNR